MLPASLYAPLRAVDGPTGLRPHRPPRKGSTRALGGPDAAGDQRSSAGGVRFASTFSVRTSSPHTM